MWKIVGWLGKFIGGNVLDRVLDTVDKRTDLEGNRDKIKGDIIVEYMRHRADFMASRGFWLLFMIGIIVTTYFGSVVFYSILWHSNGPFPQTWDIARMPEPFMEWAGWYMWTIMGFAGVDRLLNKFNK